MFPFSKKCYWRNIHPISFLIIHDEKKIHVHAHTQTLTLDFVPKTWEALLRGNLCYHSSVVRDGWNSYRGLWEKVDE